MILKIWSDGWLFIPHSEFGDRIKVRSCKSTDIVQVENDYTNPNKSEEANIYKASDGSDDGLKVYFELGYLMNDNGQTIEKFE